MQEKSQLIEDEEQAVQGLRALPVPIEFRCAEEIKIGMAINDLLIRLPRTPHRVSDNVRAIVRFAD